ncbi:hypothetical protein ACFL2J_08000 [Candidatus Omnitrophota bacterium]
MQISIKNQIVILILIFILAFCWQIFLSSGIGFFWEDFDIFRLQVKGGVEPYGEKYLPGFARPSRILILLTIGKEYIMRAFNPKNLMQIGFDAYNINDRPYQFLTWDLLRVICNKKALLYRSFKAAIFAINACLIFLIINKASRLFAYLGVILYATSAEIWISALYLSHLGLISQTGVIISVFLFLIILKNRPVNKYNYFLFALIVIFSNFAVLTIGDGRYLAAIFILTFLCFRIKDLPGYLAPLGILLCLELPIIGIFRKFFLEMSFSPINLASHPNTQTSVLSSIFMALRHKQFPIHALGKYTLLLFCIVLFVYFVKFSIGAYVSKREVAEETIESRYKKECIFIFLMWFCAAFMMSLRARNFRYGVSLLSFQIYDMAYFISPFILSLCYCCSFLKNRLKATHSTIFIALCTLLIVIQVGFNINRLYQFRGKSEEMFCSWQNAQEFIKNSSSNALALAFTQFHYKPFLFIDSGNTILNTKASCSQSKFCDLSFIEEKLNEGFQDVYVLSKEELIFRGEGARIAAQKKISIGTQCNDLLGICKKFYRKELKSNLTMYHFKKK